ncbi:MAG: hypothetical protein CL855_06700 [Cryomorphaceae bacterium]|jgi:hypothetical protein|nr:hypothetical protein [Cryomorphaceae bacterium]|tara:strand:- start:45 stop:671 length:627 start_codon:yes stop_codon:yes gene_type:complete
MDIFRLTFQLGVFFAIYSFIWFFIDLGIKIMTSGMVKGILFTYLIKAIKYLFLVNVIFLLSIGENQNGLINQQSLVPVVFILFLYFIGKFQKNQNTNALFSRMGVQSSKTQFNVRYEIGLISLSFLTFILLVLEPNIANNAVAIWFKESIIDIETTRIIGFIFKVIGFFFLLNILTKTINSFQYIIGKLTSVKSSGGQDRFDDFEEVE